MKKALVLLLMMSTCFGCASTQQKDALIKQLQNEIRNTKHTLHEEQAIRLHLERSRKRLNTKLAEKERQLDILRSDSKEQVRQTRYARNSVREFIDKTIDRLTQLKYSKAMLDHLGNSPTNRRKVRGASELIVDFSNRIPKHGILDGIGGYFTHATKFQVFVLRFVDNETLGLIKTSELKHVGKGKQYVSIENIVVAAGDLIGVYFFGNVVVPFDVDVNGDTRIYKGNIGTLRRRKSLSLDDFIVPKARRSYSLEYLGIFDDAVVSF